MLRRRIRQLLALGAVATSAIATPTALATLGTFPFH
jgi:hypothetical protein